MNSYSVTPLLLTYNEEANIARTLAALGWARRVVVLDSGSTDRTETLARSFSNVAWYVRPFDNHAAQWEFGIHETSIDSTFVLALDADMIPTPAFIGDLECILSAKNVVGANVTFRYCIHGTPLKGSIYPTQLRLFRRDLVQVTQQGHTQVFTVPGSVAAIRAPINHDDRKPFEQWVRAQLKYSLLEKQRIHSAKQHSIKDRLRLWGVMPLVAGTLSYVRSGGPLYKTASLRYAAERTIFECMLLARLLEPDRT